MQTWKARLAIGLTVAIATTLGVITNGSARAEVVDLLSCATKTPCLEWDNTTSGDAIKGVSSKGVGLHGQTKLRSVGKPAGTAGVLGEDLSTSGSLNSGVSGVSTNGTGVTGTSINLNGVGGFSSAAGAGGVYGQTSATTGLGVAGRNISSTRSANGAGVLADGGPANDAIHAFANSAADAVNAFSASGTTFFASNGSGDIAPELLLQDSATNGNDAIEVRNQTGDVFSVDNSGLTAISGTLFVDASHDNIFVNAPGERRPTIDVFAGTTGSNSDVFDLADDGGGLQMFVTDTGNLGVAGLLFSNGSCHLGCLVGQKQVHSVTEYAPTETEPTIDDNGEATLVDGVANVALDPKFANVIDTSSQYLVSVTPEGDCRGLYVSNRASSGFTVRELQGGHANVSFEYRITAKRFGVHAARLPMTAVQRTTPPHPKGAKQHP